MCDTSYKTVIDDAIEVMKTLKPICPYAENWINAEGWFTPTVPEGDPWYNKLICLDWDAVCDKCVDYLSSNGSENT